MANVDLTANATWYVKSQGSIRGPFAQTVLLTMKERGRINADAMISADRQHWQPIVTLGGAFADLASVDVTADMSGTSSAKHFINSDGHTQGPFSLQSLQDRVVAGLLGPTDPVWTGGSPNWFPAASIQGLVFVEKRTPLQQLIKTYRVLIAALFAAFVCIIVLPSWYVLGLNASRMQDLEEEKQARFREASEETRQALAKDALLKKEIEELREDRVRLVQLKQGYELQAESIKGRIQDREARQLDAQVQRRELASVTEKIDESDRLLKGIDSRLRELSVNQGTR